MNEMGALPVLENLFSLAQVEPIAHCVELESYGKKEHFANKTLAERLSAALWVLLEWLVVDETVVPRIDKTLIDCLIAQTDRILSQQLDEIMHHPEFQTIERLWRSLAYLVAQTDAATNCKIELLDVSQQQLSDDFAENGDIKLSGLYQHVYVQEYDTPGGEPFAAMITPYQFNSGAADLTLLKNIAGVSAVAHCPMLAAVGCDFFHKESIDEVNQLDDLDTYLERAEYIAWNQFRQTEDARYVGLTWPRFLLRLPYGDDNRTRQFVYQETIEAEAHEQFLWGSASYAMAVNLVKSFCQYGWLVNIRGSESGGKIENLPLYQYDVGHGFHCMMPTETIVSETRELALAKLGFIPLCYYKNSNFACFFSANSTQKAKVYDDPQATANSRINTRLPYIFLSSRIAHYLKVLQRESIGSSKNHLELQQQLNRWLQTLVTKMNHPDPELAASHPLRDGYVEVIECDDNPGFYRVQLYATPHFQIEGIDVTLSLVAQMPAEVTTQH